MGLSLFRPAWMLLDLFSGIPLFLKMELDSPWVAFPLRIPRDEETCCGSEAGVSPNSRFKVLFPSKDRRSDAPSPSSPYLAESRCLPISFFLIPPSRRTALRVPPHASNKDRLTLSHKSLF